jgi:hypothetical protein
LIDVQWWGWSLESDIKVDRWPSSFTFHASSPHRRACMFGGGRRGGGMLAVIEERIAQ